MLVVLKKNGFDNNFIDWIRVLLTNQESCIINSGSNTPYFKLGKGAHQGDLICSYLFIITLEIIFVMMKGQSEFKRFQL